ncbi:MAG: bacteriohemerythrin [Candidatus Thiodiazotropha sp. (ex Lucinoma borealis)]|nr:bacteriohemerythrin [Candidatus Thiodiazotropha sp. (ex Lucinoma borealis)]
MNNKLVGWSDIYELGIEEIDLQHHYFLNLIIRLEKELGNTDDHVYKQALFTELGLYTHFHFVSEENLMYREKYPELVKHKEHHESLIDGLNRSKLRFEKEQIEAVEVVEFLHHWFVQHTMGEDRKFAEFLESAKA